MSKTRFRQRLATAKQAKQSDREWFPKWLDRFTIGRAGKGEHVHFEIDDVVEFSKSLLVSGAPAWQRLQAVRALAAYKHLILGQPTEPFAEVIKKLKQLTASEKVAGSQTGFGAVGHIDTSESPAIQQLRRVMRTLHYSYATERTRAGLYDSNGSMLDRASMPVVMNALRPF